MTEINNAQAMSDYLAEENRKPCYLPSVVRQNRNENPQTAWNKLLKFVADFADRMRTDARLPRDAEVAHKLMKKHGRTANTTAPFGTVPFDGEWADGVSASTRSPVSDEASPPTEKEVNAFRTLVLRKGCKADTNQPFGKLNESLEIPEKDFTRDL